MSTSIQTSFERDITDTLAAIRQSMSAKQHMPTKILIYALIDSVAWAASDKGQKSTRKNFESWVARWLIPELPLIGEKIEPVDLYAARCAVLHTMTPDSELTSKGAARTIAYAWGTSKAEVLAYAFKVNGITNTVALHYDALYAAVEAGISAFLSAAATDQALGNLLAQGASKHYTYIDAPSGDPA